jgi:hypothetical protein
LQAQDRHAARPQQQHGVAGFDVIARDEDGIPRGDRCAGHRGRLDKAQAHRDNRQRIFVQHDFFGQHAVDVAAQAIADLGGRRCTFVPERKERTGHAIAHLHTRHARPDGQHFAGAVRARNDRIVDRDQVVPGCDHQVAIVERNGVHANAHFAQTEVAHWILDGLQAIDIGAVKNLVCPHGCSCIEECRVEKRRGGCLTLAWPPSARK